MGEMHGKVTIDHSQEVREIKVGERAFLYGIPKQYEYGVIISDSKGNAYEELKKIKGDAEIEIIDPYEEYLNYGRKRTELSLFFNGLIDQSHLQQRLDDSCRFNADIHRQFVETLTKHYLELENNELSDQDCEDFASDLRFILRSMNGYCSFYYDVLASEGIPHNKHRRDNG